MGWTSIKNGDLLALVAKAFDVFVTVDRNLAFQQHVSAIPVAVVILRAKSNRLTDLRALLPELMRALNSAQPGRVMAIGGP